MAKLTYIFSLLTLLYLHAQLLTGGESRKFTITNNCSYTVWPAFSSSYNGTMFSLQTQTSRVIDLRPGRQFQLWARTNCTNSNSGNFICQTGDCGSGNLNNSGFWSPSATNFVGFVLSQYNDQDMYQVDLLNGFNVPVAVVPQGGNGARCAAIGCIYDIDGACPQELKFGGACKSPCNAFNNPVYCCKSPATCQPTVYSTLFMKACPRAISYTLDNDNTIFTCDGSTAFTITFCPSSTTLILHNLDQRTLKSIKFIEGLSYVIITSTGLSIAITVVATKVNQ